MDPQTTSEMIQKIRVEHECGLSEAKFIWWKMTTTTKIHRADTVDDLKEILLMMLEKM